MNQRGRVWGLRAGFLLAFAVFATAGARSARADDLACDPGDAEVLALKFAGNHAFTRSDLANGIATDQSNWWRRNLRWLGSFFGTRHCLDHQALMADRVRLMIFYRNHGYASVAVDTIVTPHGPGKVDVLFAITEGPPTIITKLAVTGLDSVPERPELVRRLPTRDGRPFDRYAMDSTRDLLTQRLHDGGYPDAEVLVNDSTNFVSRHATVEFAVTTGPRMHLGDVTLTVDPRKGATRVVSDRAIRHVAALKPHELYSQSDLEKAKRALYQTQAFTSVTITPDTTRTPGDTTVPVALKLTEGYMHEAHAGVGYGTLDCFRTTADYSLYSIGGSATRLDLNGRVSKIGVGAPLAGLGALCPVAQSDLYSKNLNYFFSATVTQPAILGEIVPSYSLYSERRSEYDAYLRTTPIGGAFNLTRLAGRITQGMSYTVEYGRTEAQPALLCAVFNACVESDRESVESMQRLAVASISYAADATDNPSHPRRGTEFRVEFRTAGPYTGSDPKLQFNKPLVDGAAYYPLNRDIVLAARLRFGAVLGSNFNFASSSVFIPQQERLFAGGQTTVRGFPQNELGPAVYIPLSYDTVRTNGMKGGDPSNKSDTVYFRASNTISGARVVPTGGNALAVGNLEARIRSPFLTNTLEWAVFVDGGAVWNVGSPVAEQVGFSALKWTPGIGARITTQIGVLRVDVAYNPYQSPLGAAYYDAPVAAGGALFCVSPNNTLRVTTTNGVAQQATGSCPGTFRPPLPSTFFRRLAFVLTLGEAF
jgi:outer membrane protein insertion porin family/translocation and assembly module TamA